ncbi:UNVERIFIED_CONTAM: DNA-directed RNA polymerases II and IV subunitA [Sesamum calycinum]|uniref:DNA-directed RNA polymerases II and IV subunitA n=1 Tax=Sesamum calycinum TaxID=2727403 RepID=A0AAW2P7A0_9LAMI
MDSAKMVMSEEEITRLHRIRKTVMQMLKDRGYMVGAFEIDMPKHQFIQKYGENMKREDLVIHKGMGGNSSDQIYVEDSMPFIFSVTESCVSNSCFDFWEDFNDTDGYSLLQEAELLVNIKEHVLVPSIRCLLLKKRRLCWKDIL